MTVGTGVLSSVSCGVPFLGCNYTSVGDSDLGNPYYMVLNFSGL